MNAFSSKSILVLFTCTAATCLLAGPWGFGREVESATPEAFASPTSADSTQMPLALAKTRRAPAPPPIPAETAQGARRIVLVDGSPAAGLRIRIRGARDSHGQVVRTDGTVFLDPHGEPSSTLEAVEPSLAHVAFLPLPDQDLPTWSVDLVAVDLDVRGPEGAPEPDARLLVGPMEQGQWLDPGGVRALRADAEGGARLFAIPGDYLVEARSDDCVGHRSLYLDSTQSSRIKSEIHLAPPAGRAGLHLAVVGPEGESLDYQALVLVPGSSRAVRILRSEDAIEGQHWGLPEGDFELRLIARSRPPVSYYQVDKHGWPVQLVAGEVRSVRMEPTLRGRVSLDLTRYPQGTRRLQASIRLLPDGEWQRIEELEYHEGGYSVSIELAPGAVRRTAQLFTPGEYELRLDDRAQLRSAATVVAGKTTILAP